MPQENHKEILAGRQREFEKAMETNDAKKVAAFYHPDAVVVENHAKVVLGQKEIEKFFGEFIQSIGGSIKKARIIAEKTIGVEDYAVEDGRFEMDTGDDKPVTGIYTQVWKKHNGVWVVYHDQFE